MSDDVKWKMQYRHNTLPSGRAEEWFDVPATGNLVPKYGGTIDVQMVRLPGPCPVRTPFTLDGKTLPCQRKEHINEGRHRHSYKHYEHYEDICDDAENCYHRIEW